MTSAPASPPQAARSAGAFALWTLILAACVANLNLSVANVALPEIGKELSATQLQLNMVGIGFTLGLASSVLYLGALGDQFGRRRLLILGLILSLPTAAVAAFAPSPQVLIIARLLGGVAAGMVYPTTLSIITALYTGRQRVMAIALWSGVGAGASAIGPAIVGWLLTFTWWGVGFAISIPLAILALALSLRLPRSSGEDHAPVDHLGGVLSVVMVCSFVAAITFAANPAQRSIALVLAGVALVSGIAFVWRQLHVTRPIFDLHIAKRRIFWVSAVAGLIVFGSLMGSMFIGQQFLQNVLGYDTFSAGLAILPAAFVVIAASPVAARLITSLGSRITLVIGFVLIGLGFALMFLWTSTSPYIIVGATYAIVGAGVGIAAAPASRNIMASVPARALGMGSATNDLQRDLGGAIMQSVMGALLVMRYSASITSAVSGATPAQQQEVSSQALTLLSQSYTGAQQVAQTLPSTDASQLLAAASSAFTRGANAGYLFALAAAVVGLAIVLIWFPSHDKEKQMLAAYAQDGGEAPAR